MECEVKEESRELIILIKNFGDGGGLRGKTSSANALGTRMLIGDSPTQAERWRQALTT